MLATLLVEMDGISSSSGSGVQGQGHGQCSQSVIVMAATNRIDCIDAALLRKGRFHEILLVSPPSPRERELLLLYFSSRCRLSLECVQAIRTSQAFNREAVSGADIENICKERFIAIIREERAESTALCHPPLNDTE